MSSIKRMLLARWPLLLALGFALYSALLLVYTDSSSRQRLAETNAWLVGDSQRRAQSLADLLAELHATARTHADVYEIHAYLANRDLGMSMRYGLSAALGTVEARLQAKAEEFADRWRVAPPRVIYRAADGSVLADTAPQEGPPPPPPDAGAQGLRIDSTRGRIEHHVAVQHKGQDEGTVITVSALNLLYRNLLLPGQGAAAGHHELLLASDSGLPVGRGQSLRLAAPQLQALAQATADRVIDTGDDPALAELPSPLGESVLVKTAVPQAPLWLLSFVPRELAHGHLLSRWTTLAAGLLLLLMLAGALKLDSMRRRAARLTREVAAAEQQRALTEFRNRELTAEIARRTAAERALAESEQRWQLAAEGANDGIWDWQIDSGELFVSDRWLSMLGYRRQDLRPHVETWGALLHPDDRADTLARLQIHLTGQCPFHEAEFRLRCADGSYRWVLGRGKAQFDEQGRAVRMTGSHSDITERREAQARLRDRTEQLNAIFELSPDGFVSFDAERRVRFVNQAFQTMTGQPEHAWLGLDEQAFNERLAALGPPGQGFVGLALLQPAGAQPVPVQALGSPSLPPCACAETAEPDLAPAPRQTFRLQGPPLRVVEAGMQLALTPQVSQVLYFRDVTGETEVDRMKSEFLSTAAHELRTPMTSIYGFVTLLRTREMAEGKRREILDTVSRQSELMMAIINQLLDLARIEARQGSDFVLETVALQDVVGDSMADYRPPAGRAPPRVEPGQPPLMVNVDRQKIQQAVLNIVSNAYKYSPQGGEVLLRYRHEAGPTGLRHGLSLRDHGIGMTAEQLSHVWERFYRADSSGNIPGTGLGMPIVKEIVELHRGQVDITSRPGEGTEVTLWLPAA